MKKNIVRSMLAVALVAANLVAFGQAQKPTIMVVPSDAWCQRNNYTILYNDQGSPKVLPDYKRALQENSDIRMIISAMGNFMAQNNFPMKSLEQELKNLESRAAEEMVSERSVASSPVDELKANANPDIIVDLDFEKKRQGPNTFIQFNVQVVDAYSSKIISGHPGKGTPAPSVELVSQLEEAVLSFKDEFLDGLMNYFGNLFSEGREVTISFQRWADCEINFEEEYDDEELSDLIATWIKKNAQGHRGGNCKGCSENKLRFEGVRIPMTQTSEDGEVEPLSLKEFVKPLRKYVQKLTKMPVKVNEKGLGEVTLTIGGK